MVNNWALTTLGDVCTKITDGSHQSPKSVDKGMPMASVKDLNFWGLNLNTARHISPTDYDLLVNQGCKPEIGDVLIAKDGNSALDTVCVQSEQQEVVLLSSVAILRPDKTKIIPRYLKYYFMSSKNISYLKSNFISGAAIPRVILRDFKQAEIPLPSITEQTKIAHILGTLDDKIELNRQMNKTLEAMAQSLFKSWFVDFDPVIDKALAAGNEIPEPLQKRAAARQALGEQRKPLPAEIQSLFPDRFVFTDEMGWVPEGWEDRVLGEVTLELRRGISPKYTDVGGVRVINQKCIRNHTVNYGLARRNDSSLRKVDGRELLVGDILVNSTGVGTLGRMAQVLNLDEVTVVDSHVTVVRANPDIFKPYTFSKAMLNIEPTVEAMGEGSTGQTELSRANLQALKILVPPLKLQEFVENQLIDIGSKQVQLGKQSSCLVNLRDTLLPKLLSGELRIPDAEKLVAEAV